MATIEELQASALELSQTERAALVGVIVKSLIPDRDIMDAWLDEAERRDQELGDDPEAGAPAIEVLKRARAALS